MDGVEMLDLLRRVAEGEYDEVLSDLERACAKRRALLEQLKREEAEGRQTRAFTTHLDREPQPGDGPDYHAEHAAWERRQRPPEVEHG